MSTIQGRVGQLMAREREISDGQLTAREKERSDTDVSLAGEAQVRIPY